MKLKSKKIKDWFFYWVVVGVGTFILFFLVSSVWIGLEVQQRCILAQGRYANNTISDKKDCVEPLIAFLKDEDNPIGERNSAIWALGQIGDERALSILQKYYTGDIPDKEPWNEVISQYELKKAIKLVKGGINITHLVW